MFIVKFFKGNPIFEVLCTFKDILRVKVNVEINMTWVMRKDLVVDAICTYCTFCRLILQGNPNSANLEEIVVILMTQVQSKSNIAIY